MMPVTSHPGPDAGKQTQNHDTASTVFHICGRAFCCPAMDTVVNQGFPVGRFMNANISLCVRALPPSSDVLCDVSSHPLPLLLEQWAWISPIFAHCLTVMKLGLLYKLLNPEKSPLFVLCKRVVIALLAHIHAEMSNI